MNQMRTDENHQLPVYQQQSYNQYCVSLNFQWPRGANTPNPPPRTLEYDRNALNSLLSLSGTSSDLTGCQLRNPTSSLPQGVGGPSAHSSQKPIQDALQKRELRLMKNREAARECRRKKKEYVRCLENRVAVLENQNKTLIEEIRALKDIFRHKVE